MRVKEMPESKREIKTLGIKVSRKEENERSMRVKFKKTLAFLKKYQKYIKAQFMEETLIFSST